MEDIVINLQPVYDYKLEKVVFSEVLIRRYKGIQGPLQIFENIEKNKEYKQFDLNVLSKSIEVASELDIVISVNLTAKTIEDKTVVTEIANITKNNRENIIIEINEESDFNNIDVINNIHQLKELGFKIALDDFGTFNADKSVLSKCAFDIIKIDRSYVNSLEDIMDIEHNDYTIVIEGVETKAQLDRVEQLGFNIVQGFIYSKPLNVEEFRVD